MLISPAAVLIAEIPVARAPPTMTGPAELTVTVPALDILKVERTLMPPPEVRTREPPPVLRTFAVNVMTESEMRVRVLVDVQLKAVEMFMIPGLGPAVLVEIVTFPVPDKSAARPATSTFAVAVGETV